MLKGTVDFVAWIKGNGLTFPRFDFTPNVAGVVKIEIEGPGGDVIRSTVHLDAVEDALNGRDLATRANNAALDRIAYYHGMAIGIAQITGTALSPIAPATGATLHAAGASFVMVGCEVKMTVSIDPSTLKTRLEQVSPPGESRFGLYRSARLSMSPVEEYMHVYNILLMIHNDKQEQVDRFIKHEEPGVIITLHPDQGRFRGKTETIYTRLRNEFAHTRMDVDLTKTKQEMEAQLGNLSGLTRRAIELNP